MKYHYFRLGLIVWGFFLSVFFSACTQTETYCNQRFDYCLAYPPVLEPIGKSQNGDGQIFYAEEGTVELAVWGSVNGVGRTLSEEKDFVSNNRNIVYQTLNTSFFVISGYEDDKIFYRRTEATANGFRSFEIRYPEAKKGQYDQFIAQIQFRDKE